jgi:hypothetical protein
VRSMKATGGAILGECRRGSSRSMCGAFDLVDHELRVECFLAHPKIVVEQRGADRDYRVQEGRDEIAPDLSQATPQERRRVVLV